MSGSKLGETVTASVLFTDVVGSTELRSRLGEDTADEVRRIHDAVVSQSIEEHHGRVVKSMGDGYMAVFESAADAVGAAIAAQQGVHAAKGRFPEPVEIRVGASVGDVTFEDDDCFGTAVNEAARLCGAAQGGQILVADLVRALARGRGGFSFESFGALELKGLPEPIDTCSVSWTVLDAAAGETVPFPPGLVPGTGGTYIGRPDVRHALESIWQDTASGGSRTVLLVGEPGIGKTRTAYEIARTARREDAVVLFGRCDDELRVPYQPFIEALDWQTHHAPDLPLGRLAGELARLVPDLASRIHGLPAPVESDPRTEEHRLFEAVADWLSALSTERGVVLVVDDLQWATKATLRMLLHALRQAEAIESGRLLVIGTYRDTDVERSDPLFAILGDLQRLERVRRVAIDPLTVDEVIEFVEAAAGHTLDSVTRAVAARTHTETEGNPFFVAEVLRSLIESGGVRFIDGRWVVPDPDAISVPESVRDVVGQRLSRLSEDANEVLRAASIIGREFDVDLVADLVSVDEGVMLDALDEAIRARLIEEIDGSRIRFSHNLVRTSLYEEQSASRRRRMHRNVMELLAKNEPDDLAGLAHHAVEAGPRGGDLSDAIRYVLGAAERARQTRALGEAETLFRKALDLLDEEDALPSDRRGLQARCGIGEVLRDQGDPTFREELLRVCEAATEVGDDELLIRAAIANSRGFTSMIGTADVERIGHLDAALAACSSRSALERARVSSLLAAELAFVPGRRAERLALVDEAIALLEGCDDDFVVASVLGVIVIPSLVPERWASGLELQERAVAAADRCGDPNLRAQNRIGLTWTLLSYGHLERARQTITEARSIADEEAGPIAQWTARAQSIQFQSLSGELDAAVTENDVTFEFGLEIGAADADAWWGAVVALVGVHRDALVSDPDLARQFAERFVDTPAWRSVQAWALAERGRPDEALAVVRAHGLDDPAALGRDLLWLTTLEGVSRVARHVGHVQLAETLLPILEEHRDLVIHYCIGFNGPTTRLLAWVRAVLGDLDGALADARSAVDWAEATGFPTLWVIFGVEFGELLLERGTAADAAEARSLLQRIQAEAAKLGMRGWAERARVALAA